MALKMEGYPLNARCQACGEEYGDHSARGKLCPGKPGSWFVLLSPPRPRGRPPVDPAVRRTELLGVRFTDAERELLQRAAVAVDLDVSTWARTRLLEAAGVLELERAESTGRVERAEQS